jgi:hypothetical protein
MELYLSLIANVILFIILISRSNKPTQVQVEEKIVYVPEIRYRDKIEYQDRVVYQDRIVKEYVPTNNGGSNIVINNNIKEVVKPTPKKRKTTKVVEGKKEIKIKDDCSSKRAEILQELAYLKSKTKKSKQDLETIHTLESILPNIK